MKVPTPTPPAPVEAAPHVVRPGGGAAKFPVPGPAALRATAGKGTEGGWAGPTRPPRRKD